MPLDSRCPTQQESLADAFTGIDANRFNPPRYFVNVRFADESNQVGFPETMDDRSGGQKKTEDLYSSECVLCCDFLKILL